MPAPAKYPLALFNDPPAVQDEPSYSSVESVLLGVLPPKAKAAVLVPAPAKYLLPVLKAPPFVQEDPL